jgi:YHS domain-containing protein
MKARILLASLAVVLIASSGVLVADDAKSEKKEFAATCPVSGHPADEASVKTIEKDLKVYFCCDKCPGAFEKDPAKFDLQVRRQLLETGQMVQVGCPISGGPVNEKTLVEVGEAKAGFCCEKCLAKYEKASDDEKLAILFKNLPKGFTRQTMCPVSGKPIAAKNKEAVAEYEGQKVYFCCENCPKAFAADPAKFKDKLPQLADKDQGLPATKKDKG